MKICDKCGVEREDMFFENPQDDICLICKAEIGVLGEIITDKNLGEVMMKQMQKEVSE